MDANDIRKLGIDANMETWTLLQKPELTAEDKVSMIEAAYASNYLWEKSGLGTTINQARGHWLISRVMCVTGHVSLAQRHAVLCKQYTEKSSDAEDFDAVYVIEAAARALAMSHDRTEAMQFKTKALEMAERITNTESRELVIADINTEPWFGI